MLQNLPIGIQDFGELRGGGYLYVDKTAHIHRLLTTGKYYFLSRPRRFGKSLLLSTIKALYQGKKELFQDLWVENRWDWSMKQPVVHISFSKIGYQQLGLEKGILALLSDIAASFNIEFEQEGISWRFAELLKKLSQKYGNVVLLIDEYDKPIIDYLNKSQIEEAKTNQKILKAFYSIIKDSDPYLKLLLITGVSKFSKVSIFSDLNNLDDLTIHPEYATLTGYTQDELVHYFSPYFDKVKNFYQLDNTQLIEKIKEWYNGYSWDGFHFLYNPFSILKFFGHGRFSNFWFSSGTPTFLMNLMLEKKYYQIGKMTLDEGVFENYDISTLEIRPLLFQTGYLTIKKYDIETFLYTLDFPNREVKDSMYRHLLGRFRHGSVLDSQPLVMDIRDALHNDNIEKVIEIIKTLFVDIPAPLFIAKAEAYYHSIIYVVFKYLGVFIDCEVHTSVGRADVVIHTATHIYVFEFKLDRSVKEALQQVRDKNYGAKFALSEKTIIGVGINFRSNKKTLHAWEKFVIKK